MSIFFSLQENLKVIFFRDKSRNEYVDGLRAIAILLVLTTHIIFYMRVVLGEKFSLPILPHDILFFLMKGTLGVDIFFVISGFLITDILLKDYFKNNTINIKKFYLRRYLRLMPAYYVSLLLTAYLYPVHTNTIWANVLYVQNYIPLKQMFMTWTWSLAIEEQFYLIFPFFLILLLKIPKKISYSLCLLFFISIVINLLIALYNYIYLPINISSLNENMINYFNLLYFPLYSRFGPLICGVFLALIKANLIVIPDKFHNKTNGYLLFLFSLAIFFIIIKVPEWYPEAQFNNISSLSYLALAKGLFGVGIAIVMYLCSEFSGKSSLFSFLKRMLSLKIWYPIAQLSYSVFLINPLIFLGVYNKLLTLNVYNNTYLLCLVMLITILLIFIISILFFLFIERPMINWRNRNYN